MVENNDVMTFLNSLKHKRRMEFFRNNQAIQYAIFSMIIIAHIIGFYMNSFNGFLFAMILSALAYFVSPYVVTKLRAGDRS